MNYLNLVHHVTGSKREQPIGAKKTPHSPSGRSINNCITINTLDQGNYQRSNLVRRFPPNLLKFFLTSVRSLSNKADDITLVVQMNGIEFVGLTET